MVQIIWKDPKLANEQFIEKYLISDLVGIGFDCLGAYKPHVQRFAHIMMKRACELGLAEPFDYGRGKGKYTTTYSIKAVELKMLCDSEAYKIARRFRKVQESHGVTYS